MASLKKRSTSIGALPAVNTGAPRAGDLQHRTLGSKTASRQSEEEARLVDAYFSADVETDGPIPGPFSMLSFALVYSGSFDGVTFLPERELNEHFYAELRPISEEFQVEALAVNKIDRQRLLREGQDPGEAMTAAAQWVYSIAAGRRPVLVAYPLSFDWTWLYWYLIRYSRAGSPFDHSGCFDVKTAFAVKAGLPIARSSRKNLLLELHTGHPHTHHALADARQQADLFQSLFSWRFNEPR